jgi:hypothetical protein
MERTLTRAALAGALGAVLAGLAGATQSEEPATPGRGGLPGVTGTAVDHRPQPPGPDRNAPSPEGSTEDAGTQDGRSGPEPGSAGGREERRGASRGVDERRLTEIRDAVISGMPRARTQGLRVYNRDGRAHVSGVVRSEAEKEALRRKVFQLVSPEEVVLDVEVRPEGGP